MEMSLCPDEALFGNSLRRRRQDADRSDIRIKIRFSIVYFGYKYRFKFSFTFYEIIRTVRNIKKERRLQTLKPFGQQSKIDGIAQAKIHTFTNQLAQQRLRKPLLYNYTMYSNCTFCVSGFRRERVPLGSLYPSRRQREFLLDLALASAKFLRDLPLSGRSHPGRRPATLAALMCVSAGSGPSLFQIYFRTSLTARLAIHSDSAQAEPMNRLLRRGARNHPEEKPCLSARWRKSCSKAQTAFERFPTPAVARGVCYRRPREFHLDFALAKRAKFLFRRAGDGAVSDCAPARGRVLAASRRYCVSLYRSKNSLWPRAGEIHPFQLIVETAYFAT
ncbi:MAG: hypothetical protein K2G93_01565 [Rikenella sp.]|nr:hypothetical protein [Rikenella sp.]